MCCVFFREEIKEKSKKKRKRKIKKYTAIGAASVGGGVLLGTLYEYCTINDCPLQLERVLIFYERLQR